MSLFFLLPSGTVAGVVALSGETVSDIDDFVGDGWAGIRVNTDGTIDKVDGDSGAGGPTYNQIDSATDWIIPNSAASERTFHFKFTHNSGDALHASSNAEGSWIELTGPLTWYQTESGGGAGTSDHNGTLAVSDDGGSTTLASATYIFHVQDI